MNDEPLIKILTELISSRLNAGFIPDADTRHFLLTAYGIENDADMLQFLNDSLINDGMIYELTVYPDDLFRIQIEKKLSLTGSDLSLSERICKAVTASSTIISVITSAGKFIIEGVSREHCITSFIRKLGLDVNLQYLGERETSTDIDLYYGARAFLRRKRFNSSGDRGYFMKRMINNPSSSGSADAQILKLIERAAVLLEGKEEKSLDALTVKKYYYESVISENEEFLKMLKTYSMEFLMMKRIQPPSVSVDDAIESIKIINRLTSIVYGIIIPPSDIAVQMTFSGEDSSLDVFS